MGIYWKKTAEVYPDGRWRENSFTALDPDVRFPLFHMVEGDEPIGGVDMIEGGPQSGLWEWSMTVSLPGPRYVSPTNGIEADKTEAGRKVIACYRHYLSTRPEQYPREGTY
jgi:hypothetical protein